MPPPLVSLLLRPPNRRRHARAPSASGSGGRGALPPYGEGYASVGCTLISFASTSRVRRRAIRGEGCPPRYGAPPSLPEVGRGLTCAWSSSLTTPWPECFRLDLAGGREEGGGPPPPLRRRRNGGIAYDGSRMMGGFEKRVPFLPYPHPPPRVKAISLAAAEESLEPEMEEDSTCK
ncbi:uncharacterized protein SCHCODRAFT_02006037 [Schizophyllum commune H4-8]|nr:uncharacterized protein SCHCODRAFT_02006037 [Schizophyllum commune H4-8]KAI5899229.1 hypothetical protein SCHCODRAFT_02006037 [Schizophyllum commune H4-8]